MQTRIAVCLIAVLCASLLACHKTPVNPRELYLPNKQRWVLLLPSAFNGTLDTVQKLSAEFDGHSEVMLMQLEIDKKSIRLAMLNPTMMSLFSLEDDGEQIITKRSPMIPGKLDPRYVLADIQLCYWPLASLLPSLTDAGLNLTETTTATGKLRKLVNDQGELIISIDYVVQDAIQSLNFENHVWHYRYHIDMVSWDAQP